MKYFLVLVLGLGLIASACGSEPEVIARLDQDFILKVGQSALIETEGLEIKFVEVVSDSRCPTGVTCVWAGEATALVNIKYRDTGYSKHLVQPGHGEEGKADFLNYELKFDVQPYPRAGEKTDKKDYRLQLEVERD